MYDDVDWATLATAYLGHPDMEDLFAGLLSADKIEVSEADEELLPSIVQQVGFSYIAGELRPI